MSHPNAQLITQFYQAFQQRDAEAMAACYAADVRFADPVFTDLRGAQAGDMWRMLCARAQDFSLTFEGVEADAEQGRARWVAHYLFSQTGRRVSNHIEARFRFADGLIVEHRDHFDLWRWSAQALGLRGALLGWTPPVQAAIRRQAAKGLAAYRGERG
jgi:ketosteroid isomerase-like protein